MIRDVLAIILWSLFWAAIILERRVIERIF